MTTKSLWGDFDEIETIKSPLFHLQQQAKYLEEETGQILEAKVSKGKGRSSFVSGEVMKVTLNIHAPALEDYRYSVVRVEYPATIYPLKVFDLKTPMPTTCENEQEFLDKLGKILGSEEINKVVKSLISQSVEAVGDT